MSRKKRKNNFNQNSKLKRPNNDITYQQTKYTIIVPGFFMTLNKLLDLTEWSPHKARRQKHLDQTKICDCIKATMNKVNIERAVYLTYKYYEKDRSRDYDNISGYFRKIFQDCLVFQKVIPDDSPYFITGFKEEFYMDQKRPRIEITIQII